MKQVWSFLAGLFTGAIVGSVTALLFAPMRGTELRGEIANRSNTYYNEFQTRANEMGTNVKTTAESTYTDVRKRVDAGVETLKETQGKLEQRIEKIRAN